MIIRKINFINNDLEDKLVLDLAKHKKVWDNMKIIIDRILSIFSDKTDEISYIHRDKVAAFLRNNQTIKFALPAFPAKSPNRDKTIGVLPDLGDVLALSRLDKICKEIESFYKPGAKILICSDGRVFSDLVAVPDESVSAYGKAVEQAIEKNKMEGLETYHLDDAFNLSDFDKMRRILVDEYGQSLDSIRDGVKNEPSTRSLFNGMHRFIFEDRSFIENEKSRGRVCEESKSIAYELIQRSNAWSSLIEDLFPEYIRLSIHPQIPGSQKIGIQLLPSEDKWRTPWHSVALVEDQKVKLVKRKEAEMRGARFASYDSEYPYYTMDSKNLEANYAWA